MIFVGEEGWVGCSDKDGHHYDGVAQYKDSKIVTYIPNYFMIEDIKEMLPENKGNPQKILKALDTNYRNEIQAQVWDIVNAAVQKILSREE